MDWKDKRRYKREETEILEEMIVWELSQEHRLVLKKEEAHSSVAK